MLEKFDRPQTDHKEGVIENLTHKIVSNIFWSWDKQQNLKSLEGGNIMRPSEYKVIKWYRFRSFYTSNTSDMKWQKMKRPLTLKAAFKCNCFILLPLPSPKSEWLTFHLFHIIGSSFVTFGTFLSYILHQSLTDIPSVSHYSSSIGSNSMHCALLCMFCENTIHWMWMWGCYFWRFTMVIFNFARLDRKILHPSRGSWISSEYLY